MPSTRRFPPPCTLCFSLLRQLAQQPRRQPNRVGDALYLRCSFAARSFDYHQTIFNRIRSVDRAAVKSSRNLCPVSRVCHCARPGAHSEFNRDRAWRRSSLGGKRLRLRRGSFLIDRSRQNKGNHSAQAPAFPGCHFAELLLSLRRDHRSRSAALHRCPTDHTDSAYTRRPAPSNRVGSCKCHRRSSYNSGNGCRTNQRMPAARR